MQGQGVESQVKHLAVYNQETYRNTPAYNVIIDPRTEHEIYLPSFYAAVTSGDAPVMCSYAVINGNFACNDTELETTILRDEWDFQGFVMSDYGALHSTQGAVEGTDQEQPFNTYYGTALQTDVQNGTIAKSVLNTMVQRVLTVMFQYKLFSQPRTGSTSATVTTPATRCGGHVGGRGGHDAAQERRRRAAAVGSNGGSIAVVGPSASASPTYAGGGSAYVIPSGTGDPAGQAFRPRPRSGTNVTYHAGPARPTRRCPPSRRSTCRPAYSARRRSAAATRARSPRRRPAPTCWPSPTRAAATPRRTCR